MKKLLALATLLLAPAALLAASFEGKLSLTMSYPGSKPQEMRYMIKGDKMRIEMPGTPVGGMIMDQGKKEMITIMPEEKMYMVMAMPDVKEVAGTKADDTTLEKTGEKEKILGYTAEKYIATSQGQKTELWLAEGLGTFSGMGAQSGPGGKRGKAGPQAWEKALAGKELFPLRVVGREKNGKESFRMETTAIEKTSVPDSTFVPPAGYQKFDMGGMMKGMIPGFGR